VRSRLILALVGAASLSLSTLALAQPPSDPSNDRGARVAELFANGNKRFDDGDLTGAEAAYEEAWALSQSFDIAANLGAAELDQGKYREAAEHFAFALSTFPAGGSSEKRAALSERLDSARKKVGTLAVTVDPTEATLTVDGKKPDVSPYRSWIFVEPGRHVVRATRSGFDAAEQPYVAHAGQTFEVSLVLHPTEQAAATAPPPETPAPSSEGAPMWPAFVGAGLTLALVGVGVGFTVAGSGAESDAEERRAELAEEGVTCPGGCPELRDLYGDADTSFNTGVVFFVASGVAAAATLSYLFLMPGPSAASTESSEQARISPTLGFSSDSAGVGLLGAF